jgi:hypothetical protein
VPSSRQCQSEHSENRRLEDIEVCARRSEQLVHFCSGYSRGVSERISSGIGTQWASERAQYVKCLQGDAHGTTRPRLVIALACLGLLINKRKMAAENRAPGHVTGYWLSISDGRDEFLRTIDKNIKTHLTFQRFATDSRRRCWLPKRCSVRSIPPKPDPTMQVKWRMRTTLAIFRL